MFTTLISHLTKGNNKIESLETLQKLYTQGILESFIDGRIAYCINNNMEAKSQRRLATKKFMKTNIKIDNLLLY
jgi:hypothetical protein